MQKKIITLAALIALLLIIQACTKIKHEVNTFFSVDIPVNEMTTKTDGYKFGGSAVLNPNANEETKNWAILKVVLGEVRLIIKEASTTDMLFAYLIEINVTDNETNKSVSHTIDGINSLHPDNSFLLPSTPSNTAFFTDIINKNHTATVEIICYTSQSDVDIVFAFKISALVGLG